MFQLHGLRKIVHKAVLHDGVTLPSEVVEPVRQSLQAQLGDDILAKLHPDHLEAAVMEAVWTVSTSRWKVLLQNARLQQSGRLVPKGAEGIAVEYYRTIAARSSPRTTAGSPRMVKSSPRNWSPARKVATLNSGGLATCSRRTASGMCGEHPASIINRALLLTGFITLTHAVVCAIGAHRPTPPSAASRGRQGGCVYGIRHDDALLCWRCEGTCLPVHEAHIVPV